MDWVTETHKLGLGMFCGRANQAVAVGDSEDIVYTCVYTNIYHGYLCCVIVWFCSQIWLFIDMAPSQSWDCACIARAHVGSGCTECIKL